MPVAISSVRKYSPAPPGPDTGSSSTRSECVVSAGCDIGPLPPAGAGARILSWRRSFPGRITQAVTAARDLLVQPPVLDEPGFDSGTRALVHGGDGVGRDAGVAR